MNQLVINKNGVNLYEFPSIKSVVIEKAPYKTILEVLEKKEVLYSGTLYYVKYRDEGVTILGYVLENESDLLEIDVAKESMNNDTDIDLCVGVRCIFYKRAMASLLEKREQK